MYVKCIGTNQNYHPYTNYLIIGEVYKVDDMVYDPKGENHTVGFMTYDFVRNQEIYVNTKLKGGAHGFDFEIVGECK